MRQAILDSNAAGGNNTIEFDPALTGQTITILSTLPISTNTIIHTDINNDMLANDITIATARSSPLFLLEVDGTNLSNNFATIDFAAERGFGSFPAGIRVTADDASFENLGNINISGVFLSNGLDTIRGLLVNADNFNFTNEGSFVTTGRSAISAFDYDEDIEQYIDTYTTVLNNGLLQSAADVIQLDTGMIVNNGTIMSTGTFPVTPDGITITGPRNSNFVSPNAEVSTIINNGIIDGYRAGILINSGGSINNADLIEGQASAILAIGSSFGVTSELIVNNSGTLIRHGENFGINLNDNQLNGYAAIIAWYDLNDAIITNSGSIESTDVAIAAVGSAVTLINEVDGTIDSNTDGIDDGLGDDGLAFFGADRNFFIFEPIITTASTFAVTTFENAQGITIDSNGHFVIPTIGTFPSISSVVDVAFVGADNPLLPLVNLPATQENGFVVWQVDASGRRIFPSTIEVPSSEFGNLTVDYVIGAGFTITNANGDPIFDVPTDIDFGDTITNAGIIEGDISTGLGDDFVTNTGTLIGDISTCLLYTSPSPRDRQKSRMPSSA